MSKHRDLDGILLSSAKACIVSMLAHGPLTQDQRERMEEIYVLLLDLSYEVGGQKSS